MRRLSGRTGKFLFSASGKVLEKLAAAQKRTHESCRDMGKAKMRSQEVSTWVRITASNTRRARYQAAGHTK